MTKYFLLSLSLFMTLSACTPNTSQNSENYGQNTTTPARENSTAQDAATMQAAQTALPKVGEEVAVISTDLGDITLKFFPEAAPKAVENFKTHAKAGYYDGVLFHRVIDGFMIQGGDPEGTGRGGESIWHAAFEDEFSPALHNIPGAVSMANAGPNTNGSQFFINQVDNSKSLDNHYTIFGQVISGQDVVEKIAKVPTDLQDKPVNAVKMTVKIVPYAQEL